MTRSDDDSKSESLVNSDIKNADAAGLLGDLGHTAPVLISQYLRNPILFKKLSQKKL